MKNQNGKNQNGLVQEQFDLQDLSGDPLADSQRVSGEWDYNDTVGQLHTSADGRLTIEFLVECALSPSDTMIVTYNSVEYTYTGLFGLAPGWKTAALTTAQKGWISGCMLAHANATSSAVEISVRVAGSNPSSPLIDADATEKSDYPVFEGAFYGELFGGDVANKSFACQGDDQSTAIALSDDRELRRMCADNTTTNGSVCDPVTVVGRCRDVCTTYNPEFGWQNCEDDTGTVTYAQTANVYLPADNTGVEYEECGSGNTCTGGTALTHTGSATAAMLDCGSASSCAATCDGIECAINGESATTVTASVTGGAYADVQCADAGSCTVTVASSSSADVDCFGGSCTLDCTGAGASACGRDSCTASGGWQQCSGTDIFVCGMTCP